MALLFLTTFFRLIFIQYQISKHSFGSIITIIVDISSIVMWFLKPQAKKKSNPAGLLREQVLSYV
jgi:hypothetical protein